MQGPSGFTESFDVGPLRPAEDAPGSVVAGRYKLLQKLGEGGMGVVFLAEQREPVQRQVALKIIKAGMDSAQVIARFEQERQTLAMMDHANIARVLDAGTTNGRPYFVMELVKGIPITQFCDAEKLSLRRRLELFIPVCQAVQHAHQKGIIHRDLKPSNILVGLSDGRPTPKVIDFGVAKATGPRLTPQTMFTEIGAIIGTLEYMAPEQALVNNLDIDTRADIYSLGVILYELLTGGRPFAPERLRQAGLDEVLRMLREEEPPRPSTRVSGSGTLPALAAQRKMEPARLTKQLRGDLDWIVMKCLAKERNRRYETATALAEDIQHYLTDEPVTAGPPSASYRLRKFLRRRRGPVLAAGVCLFALVAGMLGTTWGLVEARRQRATADSAAAAEKLAKDDALARETETRAMLEFVSNRILAAARPAGQEGGLGRDVTLRRALEAALPRIAESFQDQPVTEANLRLTLGTSFSYLGDAQTAAEQFQRSRDLFSKHLGPDHRDTLSSISNLATSYDSLGRRVEALKLREEVLAALKRTLGPDHPDTLLGMHNLANSYSAAGRHDNAIAIYEQTLRLRKATLGADHASTLSTMGNLAANYHAIGRYQDAFKLLEETLALKKARLGPDHPDTLSTRTNLAGTYAALGRAQDAVRLDEETLALRKDLLGPDHPQTLATMTNLATGYDELGRHDEALKLREETLARQKAALGADHPATLMAMNNLAASYFNQGRHRDALELFREALAVRKARLGDDHPDTLQSMNNVAASSFAVGQHVEAAALYEEVVKIKKEKLGPDHPGTLLSMMNLAEVYLDLKNFVAAEPLLLVCQEAVDAGRQGLPSGFDQQTARRFVQLYEALDEPEEANKYRAKLSTKEPGSQGSPCP